MPGSLPEREQILVSAVNKEAAKKINSRLSVLEQAHMT